MIGEDSIAVEVNLPSSLAPMARKLSGREIGCRLSFGGETRTNWKTHTSRGQYYGAQVLRTSPERIDGISLGTRGGEAATLTVV